MSKKWMILTCFFSIFTLISSIVGSSLVFFNERIRTEINSDSVIASNAIYKSTSVVYNENNTLNISGLNPGDSIERNFSITNNNSSTIKYKIVWENVISTWKDSQGNIPAHPEEFTYTITCTNGEQVQNKKMPISKEDYEIIDMAELKTNKTNTCKIKVTFNYKENDQSYNLNKSFRGTYKVIVVE